ncbi:HisA/HisF-related TIM barrel protein [uncultured Ramlibacter sp.]|uniref:imidazole glycerol phosphate synthase subunit HisF n=1 Tax=uncultured Ramlibacter sp. TaxID=260755 RepID=UPI0026380B75|nr:HisA/HisF-related TIM barrel protein [uncultured Ramlibacter sp.]
MKRICARIDVKGDNCVKGKNYEGLRKIGPAGAVGHRAFGAAFDEVFYIDLVASLYRRRFDAGVVQQVASSLFIPFSVTGGVSGIDDVQTLVLSGVEKVGINTQAHHKPELLGEMARLFGRQFCVLSIDAKKIGAGRYECQILGGREATHTLVSDFVPRMAPQAGEILVTSIDRDGCLSGPDLELIEQVAGSCDVPVVYSGGIRNADDVRQAFRAGASAVAIGCAFHDADFSALKVKTELQDEFEVNL